ncbi:MAG: hypothetical protein ACM34M_15400 [Ignavibacteria bacterium]
MTKKKDNLMSYKEWLLSLKDHEPCDHPGCLNHVSHPCEGCGRINGVRQGMGKYK